VSEREREGREETEVRRRRCAPSTDLTNEEIYSAVAPWLTLGIEALIHPPTARDLFHPTGAGPDLVDLHTHMCLGRREQLHAWRQ
jgi:hypothetical protein